VRIGVRVRVRVLATDGDMAVPVFEPVNLGDDTDRCRTQQSA
jgi:hypothetical protein